MSRNLIAFGYYGGKNSKLNFILPQLQTPHRTYVELCGGSAAVLLNKSRVEVEALNDLADHVINFWRVLREHPAELIEQINLTPPGEAEFKRILSLPPSDDDVEMARRFYAHIAQAYAGIPTAAQHSFLGGVRLVNKRVHLDAVTERIRNVFIENTDASRLIIRVVNCQDALRRTPVLFYADPPYPADTRASASEYICEDFDHVGFLDTVLDAPEYCKFAISGYPNDLYDSRLAGWHRVEREVPLKAANFGARRTEVLWRNYELGMTVKLF